MTKSKICKRFAQNFKKKGNVYCLFVSKKDDAKKQELTAEIDNLTASLKETLQ
jgi:hypothetical protein